MTYGLGIKVDAGLVLASDSRTNAGVDRIASYPKMHVWQVPGARVLVVLSAGNLAITQAVIAEVRETGGRKGEPGLLDAPDLFGAARALGDAIRRVHDRDAAYLQKMEVAFGASFILAGQIEGEAPRLFQVYAAGNCIESCAQTPYFQIGETKYGKPILDRALSADMPLASVETAALLSFDSTMKSNLSVAPPIDVAVIADGTLKVGGRRRYERDDPYFKKLRRAWSKGLKQVFERLPAPPEA